MSSPAFEPLRSNTLQYKRERKRAGIRGRMLQEPIPCAFCGAPDARAKSHARGCPKLPPVSKEELLRIALACEAGWQTRLSTNR
jgi:hypothetical protein